MEAEITLRSCFNPALQPYEARYTANFCERCPARTAWQSGWLELLCKWQVMPRAAARSERDDRRATSVHARSCRTDQLIRSAASSPWASASLRLNMSRCAGIWKHQLPQPPVHHISADVRRRLVFQDSRGALRQKLWNPCLFGIFNWRPKRRV